MRSCAGACLVPQAVVIYWATQELSVFDAPYLSAFFDTAIGVLRVSRKSHARSTGAVWLQPT